MALAGRRRRCSGLGLLPFLPAVDPTEFEVLGVRSTREMASSWMQRTGELSEPPDDVSHSEQPRATTDAIPNRSAGAGPYSADRGRWFIRKLAILEQTYQGPGLKPLMRYYRCGFCSSSLWEAGKPCGQQNGVPDVAGRW